MALVYYVDNANGSDNNGGSSESHTADVSGTAGATDGTTVVDLSGDTPDLSGVSAGDVIRINGEANGIKGTDLFEIASADDGADTVTVTGNTPGTAGSLTWAIGGALATIDRSMNAVEAGDKVWIQGGTDYTETATLDTVGSASTWIVLEGYTSSTGDGGKATIDGGSSRANGITSNLAAAYHRFENLIFENHTGEGFESTLADVMIFVNCEFNSNGSEGVDVDNGSLFLNCSATGNSTDGFLTDGGCACVNCTAHNNTQDGFQLTKGGSFYNCIASSNGLAGITSRGDPTFGVVVVANCTVDGDGKDSDEGFDSLNRAYPICLINNIFYDCTTGIYGGNPLTSPPQIGLNNLLNSNTANYSNWNPTGTDVTGAPAFTAEGSQDYTLGSGSAAINAGADFSGSSSPGMDIGAHQSADAGGGGGLLVHPGTSGGARG